MNTDRKKILQQISALFDGQQLGVLSTETRHQPYSSLVAFAAGSDLGHLYFLTPNTTRKYANLTLNPRVSILVNNSLNSAEDIYNAVSVTAIGTAELLDKAKNRSALTMYLEKHPSLTTFANAPTTAFVRIAVSRYLMVSRFQDVVEVGVGR